MLLWAWYGGAFRAKAVCAPNPLDEVTALAIGLVEHHRHLTTRCRLQRTAADDPKPLGRSIGFIDLGLPGIGLGALALVIFRHGLMQFFDAGGCVS
ncbi:MAG: hypothetical protein ACPGYL_01985 [Rhodospirillaceae bacterium]